MSYVIRDIHIISLNVRSILDAEKFRDFYTMMMSESIDIALIQETRLTSEMAQYYSDTYKQISIISNCQPGSSLGVSVIINLKACSWQADPDIANSHIVYSDDMGRLLICKVLAKGRPLVVASVYSPASAAARFEWLNNTNEYLQDNPLSDPVEVIGADWNQCHLVRDRAAGRITYPQSHLRAELDLIDNLGSNEVEYTDGWRNRFPNSIAFSFFRGKVGISRIDRIHVPIDLMLSTNHWDIVPSGLLTDHHAIRFRLRRLEDGIKRGPGRWRMNPILLKRSEVVAQILEKVHDFTGADPLVEWMMFKTQTKDILSTVNSDLKRSAGHLAEKLARQRRKLISKRRFAQQNPDLETQFENLWIHEQNLAEWHRTSYTYSTMAKYLIQGEKPTKWFFNQAKDRTYNAIQCLKDENGVQHTEPRELLRIATKYYQNLYEVKDSNQAARDFLLNHVTIKISNTDKRSLDKPVEYKEVISSIRRAATGKSPGIDGLGSELYKALIRAEVSKDEDVSMLVTSMETFFKEIQRTKTIPQSWTDGVLTLLFKNKGDNENLAYYRPLSIMNFDYKVFTEILMKRLTQALEQVIGTHQYAFLPGRLIDDNIRLIQALIAKHSHPDVEGIYLLFLDQEKAYDRVSHEFL